ncbi:hypothetical protein PENTCL1PPCAC_4280, partial [Pristionchus entomophagus]
LPPISAMFVGGEEEEMMAPSGARAMRSTRTSRRKRTQPYARPEEEPTVPRSSSIDTVIAAAAAASDDYTDWFVGGLLPIHNSAGEEKENGAATVPGPSPIDTVVCTTTSGPYTGWFVADMLPMRDSLSPPQATVAGPDTVAGEEMGSDEPQLFAMEEEQSDEVSYLDVQPPLAHAPAPFASAAAAAPVRPAAHRDVNLSKKPYKIVRDRTEPKKVKPWRESKLIRPQEDYAVFDPHQVLPDRRDLGTHAHGRFKQFWVFLLDHLVDPSMVDTVAWTGRAREFVIRSPEVMARLWWQYRKNAPAPSVESMRRIIRAIYKRYVMIPVNAPQNRYAYIIEPSFYVGWTREQLDDYIFQHCIPVSVQPLLFTPIPDEGGSGDDVPTTSWSHHAHPQPPPAQYTVPPPVPGQCHSAPPNTVFSSSSDPAAPHHNDAPLFVAPSFPVPHTTMGAPPIQYHNVPSHTMVPHDFQFDTYWYPPPGTVMQQQPYYEYQPSYGHPL